MHDPAGVASLSPRPGDRASGGPPTSPRDDRGSAARGLLGVDGASAGWVHLWSEWIEAPGSSSGPVEWLDDDERSRAGRFRFERDRHRFVARRVFLRRVLGGYLGVAPALVRYRAAGSWRPELDPPASLNFSTSHSDGLAIVGVADRLVGVDIERLRPIPDALDLARSFFAGRESEHLRSAPMEERSAAFLRLWTRKEAYVKALGAGMSVPFDEFEVLDGEADQPHAMRGTEGGPPFVLASLHDLPGYVGSVAMSGTEISVQQVTVAALAS